MGLFRQKAPQGALITEYHLCITYRSTRTAKALGTKGIGVDDLLIECQEPKAYSEQASIFISSRNEMRYIDSGTRNAEQALGTWLSKQLTPEVNSLRWQTGFFSLNGLAPFISTLKYLSEKNLPIRALIGANEGETLKSHIISLVELLGIPRDGALLGIVSFSGAFYHPKTYHFTRSDGSQAAYVGSANLTSSGIGSLHVEAGLLLDSREGDSVEVLNQIASGVDAWFGEPRPGIDLINALDDVEKLEVDGILSSAPKIRTPSPSGDKNGKSDVSRPRLKPLVSFPSFTPSPEIPATTATAAAGDDKIEGVETNEALMGFDPDAVALIAEIGGGERWTQANFPLAIIKNFFEVEPGSHEMITLINVANDGIISAEEHTPIVAVPSQNFRFELNSVRGIAYPSEGRPIGIFLRVSPQIFKYTVLMPGDANHEQVSSQLKALYSGHAHHLKRVTVDADALKAIWSECPFWKA